MNTPAGTTRQPVIIEIGGQRLRLNANTDGRHLEDLAQLVNERYGNIHRATKNAVPSTLLALVALDLADELQSMKAKLAEAQDQANQRVAAAETRAREVEQMARRAVTEAIAEIDRTLLADDDHVRKADKSETA